jgi:hypothetical protein
MFAVTVDGKVLMNAHAIDDVDLAKLVKKKGVFVGVPLSKKEARKLSEHVYDACSEVAAFISGGRRWKKPKRRSR